MTELALEARTEWPLIERVRVLDLGPNDVVVLEAPDVTPDQVLEITRAWSAAFPDVRRPVVLSGPLTLAAVLRAVEETQ